MELLTPGIGLIFWQTVIFIIVFIVLLTFAWRPIADALKAREGFINDALKSAELAKEEMAQLKEDNELLLEDARKERDHILKEALAAANRIKEEAKADTSKIAEKMIADAKSSIENEKKAALAEVQNLVAEISLDIAEKVLRKNLSGDKAQKALVDEYIKDLKVN
ncbi:MULTISPECIES: F0F1 ATP synthase subunit B [Imperialibacter]|jgi:F-type H+-transporting ATPase subunit b|uniref:ATP synthase subunit b n=1 Tax=Imperialibacter roseus TaxID=1324217 RepID=A0ABZ0ILN4_9BACT|nr:MULTISPECIES: F0F1 ATP synthase subunit B [Imperialibacter]WOK05940.1 F0F1 ATP synthase subunit B [Imperialibacter roseus]CAD5271265.1 ATP synthase subunit b [Imperialibacter sp. 89]CAD5298705.1 ATP synthase subunit b [Imperialibacter sp. 75]VVT35017.1 ATP synthase subunit b [Imperialibacter sp. EC-SDR9]|tara:strand:+ start:150 stop:644 length:495 start_codon:yes stop_codon:yes gene_type:complete